MVTPRSSLFLLLGILLLAAQADAQSGTIMGRVIDGSTQQPVAAATVMMDGMQLGTLSQPDGRFMLADVPVGTHRVRASLIGYTTQIQEVTVDAGATATLQFVLQQEALLLEALVVTGYGRQRREAITGSIGVVDAAQANVGLVSSASDMIQGRLAGVHVTRNHGEPGAGAQVRIRGGTSISASNEPLYVIDGVPINNVSTEAAGIGIGGSPSLPRNPLALLNPADIESITVLKDASAAAIYGSRGANGVVLIETRRGGRGGAVTMEYDGYMASSTAARTLDVLSGSQYRAFVQQQVDAGVLSADRLDNLGTANTNWEDAITRVGVTQNHNLSFAGGTDRTRYRASLGYMDQQGIVLNNGFTRLQGRLSATHQTLEDRLRVGLNLTSSHVNHNYLPFENTGGFEGGVFTNMAFFNPTRPVYTTDAAGQQTYFELGTGRQSDRNPVALAEQIDDFGTTTRTLGNVSAELDMFPGVTGRINLGVDRAEGVRRTYLPRASAVGAEWDGRARQVARDKQDLTLQALLTARRVVGAAHNLEVVGGYEYNDYTVGEFGAEGRGFVTDAFTFNNLSAAATLIRPFSWRQESRLVSFLNRTQYSYDDKYFITGVLRYDGSSRFGVGNKWSLFPAISASWRLSQEDFMRDSPFSELRLRAGWGKQGNEAVPPYASLITLEAAGGARYVFGETPVIGVAPVGNPNPDLKWEETSQTNVAIDFGLADNRWTGSLEYYVKNTSDLLLTVAVPQPAPASHRLENIGSIRNHGVELALDTRLREGPNLEWNAGLVFALERNEVTDLGTFGFITTGGVSGQGQSGQVSQRIMPGHPLGTFYGAVFDRVATQDNVMGGDTLWIAGQQLFRCTTDRPGCVDGVTRSPTADDFAVIGNANPDFTLGVHSQGRWRDLDFSFLIRGVFGNDVFNNTALVYAHKSNVLQNRNFMASALDQPDLVGEPAIYSSRWIEDGSFVRLQNLTIGYTLDRVPRLQARNARVYVSADNLFLITGYSGYDPEVHTEAGLASRGIDYLSYPRGRTLTTGVRFAF
jgi:TonB-dependent starch-binding outer membrane protein SusC